VASAPPTAPEGTPGEWITGTLPPDADGIAGPVGLGFRVPMLVISPRSVGGWVSSDVFDHTSMLRLVETRFGVEVPNLSAWRRQTAGDLTATLRAPHRGSTVFVLPDPEFPARLDQQEMATLPCWSVPAVQQMPRQETVRAGLDLNAEPQFVPAGGETIVTASPRNAGVNAQQPAVLSQLSLTATGPSGWTVEPASKTTPQVVPPGGRAQAAWRVAAPRPGGCRHHGTLSPSRPPSSPGSGRSASRARPSRRCRSPFP
jgi:Phosphoesterase family/NPCBM-associated, NEW3 domain of alpha-galactosidase